LFCGTHTAASEAADNYLDVACGLSSYETIKDGGEWPRYDCPQCEEDAMVDTGNDPERYRCFSCDAHFASDDLTQCSECQRLFSSNEEGYDICVDCFGDKVNRDD